mmetsp:Transcript_14533/g.33760  ORF Transcript_14533/g.33760 Transcript_14533/m.33760 type:complete len:81 (-) Transcript_14533:611-853(-)
MTRRLSSAAPFPRDKRPYGSCPAAATIRYYGIHAKGFSGLSGSYITKTKEVNSEWRSQNVQEQGVRGGVQGSDTFNAVPR